MKKLLLLICVVCVTGLLHSQTLYRNPDLKPFYHGVASGDPLTDGVIIWTRITPEPEIPDLEVGWEIALDMEFNDVVDGGVFPTHAGRDWTVKIDVDGLSPETYYYYRFTAPDGSLSLTGRTKTAPDGDRDNVRLATVSCSSLYSGYFNAYRRIAERTDIDAVLHAGDYIYDFVDDREPIRVPEEAVLDGLTNPSTLDGWRDIHEYYHLDPDFRAALQQHPWIIMWDNHDLGNRSSENGSIQAFREWTPVRFDDADPDRIYRKLEYGGMLDIFMLDINLYRDPGASVFGDEIDDYGRSILGIEQLEWFKEGLLNSGSKWRVFCSSKPMAQYHLFGLPDILPIDLPDINDLGLPFSNNSWDGYPREREEICRHLRDNDIDNNIVVSGDIHAYFFSDIVENPYNPFLYTPNGGGVPVGAEFVTGSVSRVNLDETVPLSIYPQFGDFVSFLVRLVNPHTSYVDYVNHGYGILDFRAGKATGEVWLCNKLAVTEDQTMDVAFECRDKRNRWHRGRIGTPSTALFDGEELAPFEEFDWVSIFNRESTASPVGHDRDYTLSEIYPNPTSDRSWFRFTSEKDRQIEVSLHDRTTGAVVAKLFSGHVAALNTFLGRVDAASAPATGYYTIVVRGADFIESRNIFISLE